MTDTNKRRLELLNRLPYMVPYEINHYLSRFKSSEWLDLALENDFFNVLMWKEKENLDGFITFNELIVNFGSSCNNQEKLNLLIESYLEFENDIYFRIVQKVMPYLKQANYTNLLINKLNATLLKSSSTEKINHIKELIYSLLLNFEIKDLNTQIFCSLYINLILIKNQFDGLHHIIDKAHEIMLPMVDCLVNKLEMIAFIDSSNNIKIESNIISCDNEKFELINDSCSIIDFEYQKEDKEIKDTLYVSVDHWLEISSYEKKFYIRWKLAKMMDLCYSNGLLNLEHIKKLLETKNQLYMKIALYFLYKYYSIENTASILDSIDDFNKILNNYILCKIGCDTVKKCFVSLKDSTKQSIKETLCELSHKEISQDDITLIRAYNSLKELFDNLYINVPDEFALCVPIEPIGKGVSGWVSSLSFLENEEIINDFEGSILFLNQIYLQNKVDEVKLFKEKNYEGTLSKIKQIFDEYKYKIDSTTIIKLEDYVFGDLLPYLSSATNVEEITIEIIRRLNEYSLCNESDKKMEKLHSSQVNLIRSLKKYLFEENRIETLGWNEVKKLLFVEDVYPFTDLSDHSTRVGNHKYLDIFNRYINTASCDKYEILFRFAKNDKEKIYEILEYIKANKSIVNMAALGYHFDGLTVMGNEIELEAFFEKNDDFMEAFFGTFGFISRLNSISVEKVKNVFKTFVFDRPLKSNNIELLENLGNLIYLGFKHSSCYDDLILEIVDRYTIDKKNINKVLSSILYSSSYFETFEKEEILLNEMIKKYHMGIQFSSKITNNMFYLLSKFELNDYTLDSGNTLINITNPKEADEGLFCYYKHLIKSKDDTHFATKLERNIKHIVEKYKIADNRYFLYRIEKNDLDD